MVPNFVIMSPKDENELRHMVQTAVAYEGGPIALRFPRGEGLGVPMDDELHEIPIGRAEVLSRGRDVVFVAIGAMVAPCVTAAAALRAGGVDAGVVNARFVKPLDGAVLDELAGGDALVVTVEDNALAGGFGSAVNEYWVEHRYDTTNLRNLGLPDRFIEHGERDALLAELGLSPDEIAGFAAALHAERRRAIRSVAS
jgi:1-deoxy-D-xylulose-5-phosphate synthase